MKLLGDEADVTKLPIPIHSVGDAGRYIGSGITITKDPDTGMRNEAIIRALVRHPRRVPIWMAARHNWNHFLKYQERGKPMPMAYAIGVHPAYEIMFDAFHPPGLRGDARTEWAAGELKKCIRASVNMETDVIPVLSGGFAWHMVYPWPQRPDGVIEEAFKELAKRWRPLLDLAHDAGKVFAYEPQSAVSH